MALGNTRTSRTGKKVLPSDLVINADGGLFTLAEGETNQPANLLWHGPLDPTKERTPNRRYCCFLKNGATCDFPSGKSITNVDLARHELTHCQGAWACTGCHDKRDGWSIKEFQQKSQLRTHERTAAHNNEKIFKCKCGFECSDQGQAGRHVKDCRKKVMEQWGQDVRLDIPCPEWRIPEYQNTKTNKPRIRRRTESSTPPGASPRRRGRTPKTTQPSPQQLQQEPTQLQHQAQPSPDGFGSHCGMLAGQPTLDPILDPTLEPTPDFNLDFTLDFLAEETPLAVDPQILNPQKQALPATNGPGWNNDMPASQPSPEPFAEPPQYMAPQPLDQPTPWEQQQEPTRFLQQAQPSYNDGFGPINDLLFPQPLPDFFAPLPQYVNPQVLHQPSPPRQQFWPSGMCSGFLNFA